jgi:hypothetical protein
VNTALLLFFFRRNPHIALGEILRPALAYTLKLVLFSGISLFPIVWTTPRLLAFFAGRGRLIAHGIPLLINTLLFAVLGILLLVLTGDKQVRALVKIIRRRSPT